MTKSKKIPQDKQATKSTAIKSTKVSMKKRKKKDKASSSDVYKNNLKKSSAPNELIKNTYTNVQKSKKKKHNLKQHNLKNKLDAKDTKKSDVPTKYGEENKKNSQMFQKVQMNANNKTKRKMKNKSKLDVGKSVFPTKYGEESKKNSQMFQKVQINANSETKQKRKNKNKLGARKSDASGKYPKDDERTLEVFKKVQVNTTNKAECKKRNRKRKQDMNLNRVNQDAVTINEKKVKNIKLQMPAKNLDLERKKIKVEKLKKINEKKIKRISVEVKAQQVTTSDKPLKLNKRKIKIKQLEEKLVNKPKPKVTQLTLRDRMMAQLRASRFRFINEILYTNNSLQSKHYFKTDPDSFMAYHAGYKMQLEQWPVNPLDVIITSIKKLPTDNVIADFGCGEARLAASVPHVVHSFDFIALNDRVKACDMAHTPLLMSSVHVVVFCLSLMGSNLNDYIIEANRVLKNNGILKIAEVESRFEDVKNFIKLLRSYGFKNTWKDLSHNLFYFMDFRKEEDTNMKRKNLPSITLKSCLYKKR